MLKTETWTGGFSWNGWIFYVKYWRVFCLVLLESVRHSVQSSSSSVSCDVVEVPAPSARPATCTAPPTSDSPPSRRPRPPPPSTLQQLTATPADRKWLCESLPWVSVSPHLSSSANTGLLQLWKLERYCGAKCGLCGLVEETLHVLDPLTEFLHHLKIKQKVPLGNTRSDIENTSLFYSHSSPDTVC